MSLEEVQFTVAENHEYENVLYWAKAVTELISTLQRITMMKNAKPEGLAPELLTQRKMVLEIVRQITKTELKSAAREFTNALQKWERF